jgi:hypothetical protein
MLATRPGMASGRVTRQNVHPGGLAQILRGFLQTLVEAFQPRNHHQHREGDAE